MDAKKNLFVTTKVASTGGWLGNWCILPTDGTILRANLYSFLTGGGKLPNWGLVYYKGSWFGTDRRLATLGPTAMSSNSPIRRETGWTGTTIYDQFGRLDDGSEVDCSPAGIS